jgi:hypothetical protein
VQLRGEKLLSGSFFLAEVFVFEGMGTGSIAVHTMRLGCIYHQPVAVQDKARHANAIDKKLPSQVIIQK